MRSLIAALSLTLCGLYAWSSLPLAWGDEPITTPEGNADLEGLKLHKIQEDSELPSIAEAAPLPVLPSKLRLNEFRTNWIYISERVKGQILSIEISWDPFYEVNEFFGIRGQIGIFPLRETDTHEKFLGSEGAILSSFTYSHFNFEAGVGSQAWAKGNSPAGLVELMNIALKWHEHTLLERIFFGLTWYDRPPAKANPALEYRLGIGIRF